MREHWVGSTIGRAAGLLTGVYLANSELSIGIPHWQESVTVHHDPKVAAVSAFVFVVNGLGFGFLGHNLGELAEMGIKSLRPKATRRFTQ